MSGTALLCSLPVALFGAYYLVNAGAIDWLGSLEGSQVNRLRVRLRRINGIVMLLTSIALYLGISRVSEHEPGEPMGLVAPLAWLAVLPLLLAMVGLAWLDMRLTRKLKRDLIHKTDMDKNSDNISSLPDRAARGLVLLAAATLLVAAGCDETSASEQRRDPSGRSATRPATTRATDQPRASEEEPQQLRTVEVRLGEKDFILQVADTDAERQAGLMFRKSLAENEGMIFIFLEEQYQSFWMKNTYVPLDIAFLDENGRVLNIKQAKPHDLDGVDSVAPAKYVIELPVGAAKKAGLAPGMTVRIPESAREALD